MQQLTGWIALGMRDSPGLSCQDKGAPVGSSASKLRKGTSGLSKSSPSRPEAVASLKQKPGRFY